MKSVLFWLTIGLLVALLTHVGVLLWMPRVEMRRLLAEAETRGVNAFFPLNGAGGQRRIEGACLLRPGDGRVELRLDLPRVPWTVTVYHPAGHVIYMLARQHSPAEKVTLRFSTAALETNDDAATDDERRIVLPRLEGTVMEVPLRAERALAVVRAYAPWPGQAQVVRRAIKRLRCAARP